MKRHWPVLILLVLAFVAARWHASLNSMRFEQATLNAEMTSLALVDRVHETNDVRRTDIGDTELESLRQSARRVYRLRGNVTLAQQQLDQLTPVVSNLAARLQARTNQVAEAAAPDFPPGYISRNDLADRGNATPEAALETFWWALSHGDGQRLMELMAEMIGRKIPDDGKNPDEALSVFREFPGYQIVRKQSAPGGQLLMGVETAPGARIVDLGLIQTNGQWYVVGDSFNKAMHDSLGN